MRRAWLLLLLLPLLSGCWDMKRLQTRTIVTSMGIDPAPGGKLSITFRYPLPSAMIMLASGGGGSQDFGSISATGHSVLTALSRAQNQVARDLYLGHTDTVVLSDGLKAPQLRSMINELVRIPEIPNNIYLLYARSNAADVATMESDQVELPGRYLRTALDAVHREGFSYPVELWQFFRDVHTPGQDPVLPEVRLVGKEIDLRGLAVFQGYRRVGYLSPPEVAGYNFLLGRMGKVNLSVPTTQGLATVRSIQDQSKISLQVVHGQPQVQVKLSVTGEIDQPPASSRNVSLQATQALTAGTRSLVLADCRAALQQARKWQADIFGFGKLLDLQDPTLFRSFPSWDRDGFPHLPVKVTVAVHFLSKGYLR